MGSNLCTKQEYVIYLIAIVWGLVEFYMGKTGTAPKAGSVLELIFNLVKIIWLRTKRK